MSACIYTWIWWHLEYAKKSTTKQNIRNILGKDRVSVAFSESCIINNGRYYVAQLDSRLLPENWRDLDKLEENELESDRPLLIFEYEDQKLVEKESQIPRQESIRHSYYYECADFNNDSLDEIYVSTKDGNGILYIQSASGNFVIQNEVIFPKAKSFQNLNQVRSILDDINEDGMLDLIYYSNAPSTLEEVNFEIYWGD